MFLNYGSPKSNASRLSVFLVACLGLHSVVIPQTIGESQAQQLMKQLHLESPNPKAESLPETVKKLIALGELAIPYLKRGLDSPNIYVSDCSLIAMERIGCSAIDIFIKETKAKSSNRRKRFITALGFVTFSKPAEAERIRLTLMPFIYSHDPAIRKWVVYGLQRFSEHESVKIIMRALKDPFPSVRRQAAYSLRATNDSIAGPAIKEALADKDPDVRKALVSAIGSRRDNGAFNLLMDLRNDPSPDVRWNAVVSLGSICDKRTIRCLVDWLDDTKQSEHGSPSTEAAGIIGRIIGRDFKNNLASVSQAKNWWATDGKRRYGNFQIPTLTPKFTPLFIPGSILPNGWEILYAEECGSLPGWEESRAESNTTPHPIRHYHYWQPDAQNPSNTIPHFDLYLLPQSWSGHLVSKELSIPKSKPISSNTMSNNTYAIYLGKTTGSLVFYSSVELGEWKTALKDFTNYLKIDSTQIRNNDY